MGKDTFFFNSMRTLDAFGIDGIAYTSVLLRPGKNVYEVYTIEADNRVIGIDACPDDGMSIFKDHLYIDTDYDEPVSRGFFCDEVRVHVHDKDHASVEFRNVEGDKGVYGLTLAGSAALEGNISIRHYSLSKHSHNTYKQYVETLYPYKE